VIYCYHKENKPIPLLQISANADQENLTAKQKMSLKKPFDVIIESFD
jgi:hypothetical protein